MKVRKTAAVWAAKAAGFICKKMGRQGVTWAGKIALKIYPPILSELAEEVREKIFVVCGTNGKTTTNNMLCAALEAEGKKVAAICAAPSVFAGLGFLKDRKATSYPGCVDSSQCGSYVLCRFQLNNQVVFFALDFLLGFCFRGEVSYSCTQDGCIA